MVWNRDQTAIEISRSKQNLSHTYKSTFLAGFLYPLWSYSDILPGDTIKLDLASVIRMATPAAPVMDDCYADVYVFFTPHKVTMQKYSQPYANSSYSWKYFIGAQDFFLNMPLPASDVRLPTVGVSNSGLVLGSFYERLGLPPTQYANTTFHALDYMAYMTVWNDFFRDQNTMNPMAWSYTNTGSITLYGGPNGLSNANYFSVQANGDDILPVSRPHGYFGSCLPWPQRNISGVTIPLLGNAIVEADGYLELLASGGGVTDSKGGVVAVNHSGALTPASGAGLNFYNDTSGAINGEGAASYYKGLKVDLSNVSAVTINQLRALIAKQHFEEALARGGNRLGELSASLFGVTPHDAGDEHPEYLGGKRIPITVSEVVQSNPDLSSGTSGTSGLGKLGAMSKTCDKSYLFEKSFDTWGTLQVFICFRTNESFTNGLPRRFTRATREDFYFPCYARIGDMAVLNREIKFSDTVATDAGVFGYQKAWAEYKFEPDVVTGLLRPSQSLGYFTYANNFSSTPTLKGYLEGGDGIKANVDRTLQVGSGTSGFQFIGDFYFHVEAIRPMPADDRPGLTRI